jgi:hypothetical protein
VLLILAIYLFGTAIAQLTAERLYQIDPLPDDAELIRYFGSLIKALFTLFASISGGLDWENAFFCLWEVGVFAMMIYFMFIVFASFCVMNVIIGIFCQSAMEAFEQDAEKVLETHNKSKNTYVNALVELFHHIDSDHTEKLTLEAFERGLEDHRMQAILRMLEIERRDALAIFHLLEANSGNVCLEQFVTGCINFRGNAKAIQVERLVIEVQALDRQVRELREGLGQVTQLCQSVRRTVLAHQSTPPNLHSWRGQSKESRPSIADSEMRGPASSVLSADSPPTLITGI